MLHIRDRFHVDLTAAALLRAGLEPVVAGYDWELRFQVRRRDGAAEDLTNTTIVMTFDSPSGKFTRTSGVVIAGTSVPQVERDADQSAVSSDGKTGRGWFAVRGSNEDEAAMRAIGGCSPIPFDIAIRWPVTDERSLFLMGVVEVVLPHTSPAPT